MVHAPLAVLMLVGVAGSAYWFVLRPGALLSPPETRASPAVTVPTTDGDESGTDELEIHLDGDTPTIEPAAAKDGEPTAEGAAPAVELWTSVESKPAGATVTRGEEVLGETPLSVAWIEGVATRVRIEREGYAPVTVSLGEDVVGGSLHVELVRERAGKKAPTAEATITRTSGR